MLIGITLMLSAITMILFLTVYTTCIVCKLADEAAGYEKREEKQWRKRT